MVIRGVIINTKELSPTHINHAHLNGTSLPRNILSLVTPPTHCNDTVPHTLTHKDHPLIPVISQIEYAGCEGGRMGVQREMVWAVRTYCFKATALFEYCYCQIPNENTLMHAHTYTHTRRSANKIVLYAIQAYDLWAKTKHQKILSELKCAPPFLNKSVN